MIKKPCDMDFSNKKIAMIIAGVAGIGKTTLALSAPKPLLIDLDKGIDRVEAKYRKDTVFISSFEELKHDLFMGDLKDYETIVIDTGGKLLEFLKPVLIAEDPKNGKRNGELSLQGYGSVKRKFREFIESVKQLDKNVVVIFHATEVNLANDVIGLRIRIEGGSKDEVWDNMDLGCFLEMCGKKRTVGFSNCERYYAKGTHSVTGTFEVPQLENGSPNNFLTLLFEKYHKALKEEVEKTNEYDDVMLEGKKIIEACKTEEDLNKTIELLKGLKHKLTSKEELWFCLTKLAKQLGCKYEANARKFTRIINNSVAS